MFSPVVMRTSSSCLVWASSSAMSPSARSSEAVAMAWAISRKLSLRAVKSVSARISRMEPRSPSIAIAMHPSPAARSVRVSIFPLSFSRRASSAAAASPPASMRAFLQSIIPRPVFRRRAITSLALTSVVDIFDSVGSGFGEC